jgi:hypothetical protein
VFVCSFQIGTGCGRKWCSYLIFKSGRNVDVSSGFQMNETGWDGLGRGGVGSLRVTKGLPGWIGRG